MNPQIKKQIEEEALRRFPEDEYDDEYFTERYYFKEGAKFGYNIKESVNEKNLIRDAQLLAAKEIREYWKSLKTPDNEFYNNHSFVIDSTIVSCIEIIEKCVLTASNQENKNTYCDCEVGKCEGGKQDRCAFIHAKPNH